LSSLWLSNGIIYMTICDNKYPKKLSKAFNLELAQLFEDVR